MSASCAPRLRLDDAARPGQRERFTSPPLPMPDAARLIFAAAVLPFLAACTGRPHAHIDAGVVRNATGRELTDVTVTHLPNGRLLYGNDLLPGRELDLRFHDREMTATAVRIRWTDPALGVREVELPLDNRADGDAPVRVIYEILPRGDARVSREADTGARRR